MSSRPVSRRMTRAASALTLVLGSALATPLLVAGTAEAATSAATVAVDNGVVVYTAASGQTNNVSVTATRSGADFTYAISDDVTITTGDGCSYAGPADRTRVSCLVTGEDSEDPYATLQLSLGDGDDTVAYDNQTGQTYYFASIDLGDGNDTLTETGGVQGNSVSGDAGDDTLTVGPYTVALGGDGDDTIKAAKGAIVLAGDGDDTVYATGNYTSVDGGAGKDVIHGGAGWQDLSGGDGNDRIYGGPGDDHLSGGNGKDVLRGGKGDDTINGDKGDDHLYGGPGTDTLDGGPGTDVVHQD
ncbi:calcium-binding protein [Actinacidiphila yeochonensis]|uniref:calcium-binding protein n=1 Tax=Actinacidiphila yeochonensis TaxID=89050 RepID=UPI000565BA64|nr:calcium-binding protein [Actinacidiphila yeochonensis]